MPPRRNQGRSQAPLQRKAPQTTEAPGLDDDVFPDDELDYEDEVVQEIDNSEVEAAMQPEAPEPAETPREDELAASNGLLTQEQMDATPFRKYWLDYLANSGVAAPPNCRIVFPGEPITYTGHRIADNIVIVDKDIYRMAVPFRGKRPIFLLEVKAGTQVNSAQAFTRNSYAAAIANLSAQGA